MFAAAFSISAICARTGIARELPHYAWRQQVPKLLGSRCSAVFSVTRPIRSTAVILVEVIRDLEDAMSAMNPQRHISRRFGVR
jgi:hypothetical protein